MNKRKSSVITAGLLASVLLSASPFALADDHKDGPRDKPNMEKMCEQFKEGKGPFDRKERQEKMEKRQNEIADRLKLDKEQRKIWDEIHQEQREKHEKRMEKWKEKMEKRCN